MTDSPESFPLLCREMRDALFWSQGQEISAATFLAAVHRVADALPDAPFVINACQDRLWFTIALAAAITRGQVMLLTSDRSPDRLRALADSYPGLCLLSDQAQAAAPVRQQAPVRQHVLAPFSLAPFSQPGGDGTVANPCIPTDRLVAIVFTSGSTGEPIAHHKNWGMLVERSIDAAAAFGFSGPKPHSVIGMVPPHHMYGFETTVLLPMHVSVTVWCDAAFYPQDVAAALNAVPEPRILVTTPLQIGALLRGDLRFPALDRVISATAPLFHDVARTAEQAWNTRVEEIFGATEVGSIASRRTIDGDVWRTYPRVRLTRDETGNDGEIKVHAPFATPRGLSDLFELLDSSRFRLIGRRSDVIKCGGRRTSLSELNRILTSIDGVIDGQFFAPDDLETRPGARLLVFAVAPGLDASVLLRELRSRIDPLFLPRRVVLVDSMPRNDVGKLTKGAMDSLSNLSRVA